MKAREKFVKGALRTGFDPSSVYRPMLKDWMFSHLRARRYQEKQVDATVVALAVRSAITQPSDYHVIVTGDADILPAIRIAHESSAQKVLVATTSPGRGKSARALTGFSYGIAPYFLDQHVEALVEGEHVYTCAACDKLFEHPHRLYDHQKPCCSACRAKGRRAVSIPRGSGEDTVSAPAA